MDIERINDILSPHARVYCNEDGRCHYRICSTFMASGCEKTLIGNYLHSLDELIVYAQMTGQLLQERADRL